jgi:hypothetical protein
MAGVAGVGYGRSCFWQSTRRGGDAVPQRGEVSNWPKTVPQQVGDLHGEENVISFH